MRNQFWTLILGSGLAVIGGFAGQEYAGMRQRQRLKSLLSVLLDHQIQQMNRIIDKLSETYDKTKIPYVIYLTELQNARVGYDRNSDWIILFSQDMRQKIFDYFNKEQLARSMLSALVAAANDPKFQRDYVQNETQVQVENLKAIRQLGEQIRSDLND